jgi:ClpP class serine protease
MIACTASPGQLFAAPFAVLGSIGVVGQVVNVHKALTGWGVDPIVFRGGKDKAPISALGEVTVEGKTAYQNVVDNVHRAFKRHVVEARPVLEDSIEEIATGDIWLGRDALHRGLIDRLITSDEYIAESIDGGARVLKLVRVVPSKYPFLRPTLAHVGAVRNGEGRRRSYGMLQGLLDRVLNSFVDSKSNPPLEFPPAKAAVLADLRCNVMRDVESLIEPGLRLSPSVKYAHNSS